MSLYSRYLQKMGRAGNWGSGLRRLADGCFKLGWRWDNLGVSVQDSRPIPFHMESLPRTAHSAFNARHDCRRRNFGYFPVLLCVSRRLSSR